MSSRSEAFVAYANLVRDLREALTIVNTLRINIARGTTSPTAQLNALVQGISVPFLKTSTNELFMEPTVLPIHTNVACTIHVARGEGDVYVNAVDANTVQVITGQSHTSYKGGTIHVLRLLQDEAFVTVTFLSEMESINRTFQLKSV